jgi:hypothetical protein
LSSAATAALRSFAAQLDDKGEYGGPPPDARSLTINHQNITVVPVEKLTDAELEFYAGVLKSGRATSLALPAPPREPERKG